MWSKVISIIEPRLAKTCLQGCPSRWDSHRPTQLQKLASHKISDIATIGVMLSRQQATEMMIRLQMRRLICIFVVGIWH